MKTTSFKIRTGIALIALAICSLTLSAQSTDGGGTKIMQDLAARYKTFATMQIDYTYKVESNKKITKTQTGKAQIKGNKYYITFGNQSFYCDGASMWNYEKTTNEVSIYTYEESDDDALNPAKMLKNWQKEFTAKLIREDMEGSKPVQIIDLTPKTGQSYFKIRLIVDKARKEIVRTSIYGKDNTIFHYYFDKFVTNTSLSDSTFVFDKTKFPKVEINDMR